MHEVYSSSKTHNLNSYVLIQSLVLDCVLKFLAELL